MKNANRFWLVTVCNNNDRLSGVHTFLITMFLYYSQKS